MGIYGALSSAVTGLRAQAHALENISGNIANSQTTGYKRIETDFLDLIPDAPVSRQVPGAVLAQSRGTNDIGGDIRTVSNETFIALNSNGFFVVEPKIGQSDGTPVFAGTNFYTRRGDFEIDKDGMLVNGAGYYLKGLLIDPGTGNISGSVPAPIRLSNSFLEARQTNRINYQANLPQLPKTSAYDKAVFNSELMQSRNYTGSTWSPASVTGTAPLTPAVTTATAAGNLATPLVPGATAGNVFGDPGELTIAINGVSRKVTFDSVSPTAGLHVNIAPGTTIQQLVDGIEAAFQGAGGDFVDLNVDLAGGQIKADMGSNLTDSFDVAAGPSLAAMGLVPGTYAKTTNSAATQHFIPGSTIKLNVNGTEATFEFTTTTPYTGPNRPVDVSGTIDQAVANLQAAIRANGGPSAASAKVELTAPPASRLSISLGSNHYASFSIEEGEASLGLATNAAVSAPTSSRIDSVSADQNALFLSNSIQGTAITVFAKNGAPADVQLRWAKVSSEQAGGADTWNLFYMSNSLATGGAEMWKRVPQDFTFNGSGTLETPTEASVALANLSVNGVLVGDIEFRFDTNGLSQFADVNGKASVSKLGQNGYGAGQFVSVAINDDGRVTATYSNGERIDMAQVVTANFNAINQLKRLDGGVFSSTSESGEAIIDTSGSGVMGGALEASNTDISDEFTKLIVTQQAYAAGTRIVSAADKMLQEALNMIR